MTPEQLTAIFNEECENIAEDNPGLRQDEINSQAIIQLLDRGVITTATTPTERYRQRQADAAEFVQDLARSAGYDRIEGFIILYAFKEGLAAFGIGSVASDGQVWDALKRINEKQLAQHLFHALRIEQSQQNGGGGLIVPG